MFLAGPLHRLCEVILDSNVNQLCEFVSDDKCWLPQFGSRKIAVGDFWWLAPSQWETS